MAWRFQKRIKLAPGIRLNISKRSMSLTGGIKGASVNIGKDGKHLNLGAPGTGFSTRTRLDAPKNKSAGQSNAQDQQSAGIGGTIAAYVLIAVVLWMIWAALT